MPSFGFIYAIGLLEWVLALTAVLMALLLVVALGPRGRGSTMLGFGLGLHLVHFWEPSALQEASRLGYWTQASIALAAVSGAAWLLVALGLLDLVRRAPGIKQKAPAEPRDARVPDEGSTTFER